MGHNAPKWVVDLFRTLKAKTLQEFCGGLLDTPKLPPEDMKLLEKLHLLPPQKKDMLEKMWNMKIAEKIGCIPASDRFFSGVFPVPKSNGLWRFIFDCRETNAWIPSPAALELCSVEDIFSTVRCFTHFATFDLRHAFYMCPLPDVARNLFVMAVRDDRGHEGCSVYRAACLCRQHLCTSRRYHHVC